jgi:magnesium-transporting ATPase (P-type)
MPRKKSDEERVMQTPGFAWRVSLSIIAFFGIVVFFIIWLFFYAGAFTIYQNIAVFISALLIFIAIMAGSWVSWGIRYGRKYDKKCF